LKTLSRKCQYALRALYCLTSEYERGLVSATVIADRERVPRKFLETILRQARRAGLVDSRRGKNGGYYLALPPGSITVGSIIRAVDGPLAPLPWAGETSYRGGRECQGETRCETFVMRQVRDAIARVLDDITLSDLARQSDEAAEVARLEI
jgi:Rrf2 family protein